jgi:hypothetical protein
MAETSTLRFDKEDEAIISLIREQLTDTIGKPTRTDCIRYALKIAKRELAGKLKPRYPRNR